MQVNAGEKMAKNKTVEEKADEIGLNKERIAAGLKSHKKEVTEAVDKAYAFMNKKR